MRDRDLLGTPCRESGYLFSGLWRGKGKGRREKSGEAERETEREIEREEGEKGEVRRRERVRSCLFGRETERKGWK